MKKALIILCLIMGGLSTQAQDMAMIDKKNESAIPTTEVKTEKNNEKRFVVTNYGIDLSHKNTKNYPPHPLGDTVAKKWFATRQLYVQKHLANIGLTDNITEITKPIIYHAIIKLDTHLKKMVRRHEITTDEAANQLSRCLDIAYILYYEDDTKPLENALKKTHEPQKLLALFSTISIEE